MREERSVRFRRGERMVWRFVALASSFAILTLITLFVPSATVTVTVRGEPVVTIFEATVSTTLAAPSASLRQIPGRAISLEDPGSIITLAGAGWVFDHRAVTGQGEAVLYRTDDLYQLSVGVLVGLLQGHRALSRQGFSAVVIGADGGPSGSDLRLSVRATGLSVPSLPVQTWRQTAGYSPAAFIRRLRATPGVEDVSVVLRPRFWPLLPLTSSRLEFALDIS